MRNLLQTNEERKDYRDSRVSTLVKMQLNTPEGSGSSKAFAGVD